MKKLLTLLALSICLIGCVSLRQPRSKKIAEVVYAPDLHSELFPLMPEGSKLVVMDWRFVSIPEDRTRKLIDEALFRFDTRYVIEARDCDDIAIEYVVRLRELFRRELKNVECAAPIGLVGGALTGDIPELKIFMRGQIGYHAMTVVRCSGGKWLLIEPRLKRVGDLSAPIYEGCFDMFLGVF